MKQAATATAIPDPTPVLFLIAVSLALLWAVEDTGWPALVTFAGVVTAVAVHQLLAHPRLALFLLLASVAMPRIAVSVGTLNARPENVMAGFLLLALPFWIRRYRPEPRWMVADTLVLLFIALNLFSSVFGSVEP